MHTREELKNTARQWISLWCTPVDWALFDRLHVDRFEDCSSAGRPPQRRASPRGWRSSSVPSRTCGPA